MLQKLRSFIASEDPKQVNIAICFGVILGLTPFLSIHNIILLLLACWVNINFTIMLISFAIFSVLGLILAPIFHSIGSVFLNMKALEGLWTALYNSGLRATHFNHTVVMGSIVCALILAIVFFFVLNSAKPRQWITKLAVDSNHEKVHWLRKRAIALFLTVLILLVGGVFALLNTLVKSSVETEGSKLLGSQVGIAILAAHISPASMDINGLEIASSKDPLINDVQVDKINMQVDLVEALGMKLVVNEMSALGIRFQQPRKSAAKGNYPKKTAAQKKQEEMLKEVFGEFNISSPEEILKKEKLKSLEEIKKARKDIEAINRKWQNRLKNDLNPKRIDQYQREIAALQKKFKKPSLSIITSGTKQVNSLKNRIQKDINSLSSYKTEIINDQKKIRALFKKVKNAATNDYRRLKKKYSPSMEGGLNIIGAVFGDKIKKQLEEALNHYEKLNKTLNSSSKEEAKKNPGTEIGEFVHFNSNDGKKDEPVAVIPTLLVKKAKLSVHMQGLDMSGTLENLSSDQKLYGKPMVLSLKAKPTKAYAAVSLQVKLDKTTKTAQDQIGIAIKDFNIENYTLSKDIAFSGQASAKSAIKISGENNLSGEISLTFAKVSWTLPIKGMMGEIAKEAFSGVKDFQVKLLLKGTVDKVGLDVKTNLAEVVSKKLKSALTGKTKDFEKLLQKAVNKKVAGQGKIFGSSSKKASGTKKSIGSQNSQLQQLINKLGKGFIPSLGGSKLPW